MRVYDPTTHAYIDGEELAANYSFHAVYKGTLLRSSLYKKLSMYPATVWPAMIHLRLATKLLCCNQNVRSWFHRFVFLFYCPTFTEERNCWFYSYSRQCRRVTVRHFLQDKLKKIKLLGLTWTLASQLLLCVVPRFFGASFSPTEFSIVFTASC
jgi:hypothetical protein